MDVCFPFDLKYFPTMTRYAPIYRPTYNVESKAIRCLLNVYDQLDDQMEIIRMQHGKGHLLIGESLSELCDWGNRWVCLRNGTAESVEMHLILFGLSSTNDRFVTKSLSNDAGIGSMSWAPVKKAIIIQQGVYQILTVASTGELSIVQASPHRWCTSIYRIYAWSKTKPPDVRPI